MVPVRCLSQQTNTAAIGMSHTTREPYLHIEVENMDSKPIVTLAEKVLQPMHDRVLVECLQGPEKIGSIFVPDVARKAAILCKVLAVGPGRWIDGEFQKTAVKPGDTVLVPHSDRWASEKLADWKQGEQVLIMAGDIGAIVG